MGLRGDVGDGTNLEARRLQGTDSGLTTGTRALDEHVDLLDAVLIEMIVLLKVDLM